jgi:hypothetical protein
MKTLYLTILICLSAPSFAALPEANVLLDNWKEAMYTPAETSKIKMTITRPGQDSIVREADVAYKSNKGQDTKIYMRFTTPAKIKGTAFLSLKKSPTENSDQWIYFPAYKKARRLSSRKKTDAFLDSDFNNGDISFEYHLGYTFKVLREDKLGDKAVYVVEGTSPAEADTLYSKQILYIDRDTKLNLRSDFYNKKGELFKEFIVEKWGKYTDHWAIDSGIMRDIINKGETKIEFVSRNTKKMPTDSQFTLVHLERGE